MSGASREPYADLDSIASRWVARRDAGLSAAEAAELQRWLDADPRHRAAFDFHASTWAALARPAQTGSVSAIEEHLFTLRRRRVRRRRVLAGAGALMVVMGLWPRQEAHLEEARIAVVRPAHEVLPDHSEVELKPGARIEVQYTASLRRVLLLGGEAYFSVRPDPTRPFAVLAGGVEVKAVGTAFSVQMDSAEIAVLVTDGRVAVAPAAATDSPATAPDPQNVAVVDAGRRLIVGTESSAWKPESKEVPPAELQESLAWRSPRLEFTRASLAEAVALFNEHAPAGSVRLEVSDARAAALRISGVFRADNADAFVMLLEGTFSLTSERSENTITLRSAPAAR